MAKKDVSTIVSGMGAGLSILQSFTDKARKRGCSDEDIHSLATPEGDSILDKFADLLVEATAKAKNLLSVTVDYNQTVEKMVKAGKYDWTNSDVNSKHFPVNRRGIAKADIVLVQFDRAMESEDVLRELDKQGLRPAELPELLAFGAAHPEKQREFPIVALGSVWRWGGGRSVACLRGGSGGRCLGLNDFGGRWYVDGWFGRCRFAAVRK